jgi:hypothetical protein
VGRTDHGDHADPGADVTTTFQSERIERSSEWDSVFLS